MRVAAAPPPLLKERIIVADVATDINGIDEYRDLAIKSGIRAAWFEPILTKDGEVLGTFTSPLR
jgi:hypothetical protein